MNEQLAELPRSFMRKVLPALACVPLVVNQDKQSAGQGLDVGFRSGLGILSDLDPVPHALKGLEGENVPKALVGLGRRGIMVGCSGPQKLDQWIS
jgi:hypothetical protein